MPVQSSSKEAYGRMRSIAPKEHPVYKFLKTFGTQTEGYSNRQIAAIMGRPINTITPRIFELRNAGVVVLAGKRKDLYSGVTVMHWRIASEIEERRLQGKPLTWTHLGDLPIGVEAIEEGTNWIWIRREDGQFGYKFGERDTFGGWGVLGGEEAFYGPMTEVL